MEENICQKKILIVDDDNIFLDELGSVLGSAGYEITTLSDSTLAVRFADQIKPDLIILDLKMSGRSGFQVADDLKHFNTTSKIPIIAMSAYFVEKAQKAYMHGIGIEEFIVKPFNPLEIISKIEWIVK